MKTIVFVAVMLVSSSTLADRQSMQDAMRQIEQFADDMCKCKDNGCALRVGDAMNKWSQEMAKKADKNDKPDPADVKKMQTVVDRLTKCMTAAMTPPTGSEGTTALDPPKSGPELLELSKTTTGTWRCTGKLGNLDVKATMTSKVARDLDDTWIQTTISIPVGKVTMKTQAFTTYNDGRWYRHSIDNGRHAESLSSAGLRDGKYVWEGESQTGGKTTKVRYTEDFSDPKTIKVTGEKHRFGERASSDDKGWTVELEFSCKK